MSKALPDVITVVIEFDPKKEHVNVRGAFKDPYVQLKPINEGNVQNYVQCFVDVDMKKHVGFSGVKDA